MKLRTIIVGCRACAFVRGRTYAEPRRRETAPAADERNIDTEGWVHEHPVTDETERLADEVHPRATFGPYIAGSYFGSDAPRSGSTSS